MKTIKAELLKLVIVIIIVNLLALSGSILIQNYLLKYANTITSTEVIVEDQTLISESSYSADTLNMVCYDTTCVKTVYSANKIIVVPYIFYILMQFLILAYSLFKVKGLLLEIELFKNSCEYSLSKLEPIKENFKLKELSQINAVVNNSILSMKRSQLMERELVTFTMHDIKTPMQIIQGNIDLIKLNDGGNDNISSIENQIKIINKMVESCLDDQVFELIDISALINELIEEYKQIYTNINFNLEIEDNDIKWRVNKYNFRRIITNFLDNGIKSINIKELIVISISKRQIIIANSSDLKYELSFDELLKEGKGHGLEIIEKYAKVHNFEIELKNNFKTKMVEAIIKCN